MEWYHTAIPKPLAQQIQKIKQTLGYTSIGAFIAEATRKALVSAQRRYDEIVGDQELGRKIREEERG